MNVAKYNASEDGFGTQFGTQFRPTTCVKKAFLPFASKDIHEIHPARVRDIYGDDTTEEKGRDE